MINSNKVRYFKLQIFASILILVLFLISPQKAHAFDEVLDFDESTLPLKEFPLAVQSAFIKNFAGKTLKFSNGKSYKLGDFLGAGETTAIFEIKGSRPPKAIRIPIFYSENSFEKTYIDEFISGAALLSKYGAPVVQIYDSLSGDYVVVDRLSENSLSQERLKDSSLEIKRKAAKSLKKLASDLAAFNDIGDFKLSQLHYDPLQDKWTLADWRDNKALASHYHVLFDPQNPNDHFNNEIQREIFAALDLAYDGSFELKNIPDTLFEGLTPEERIHIAEEIMREQSKKRAEILDNPQLIIDAANNKRRHTLAIKNRTEPASTGHSSRPGFLKRCLLSLREFLNP